MQLESGVVEQQDVEAGLAAWSGFGAVDVRAPAALRAWLDGIGRTEDIAFSPDNRRLAIAGFGTDRIVVVEVVLDFEDASAHVDLIGITEIRSPCLRAPHGLSFLDNETLVVANRFGEAPILPLPPPMPGLHRVDVEPVLTIRADGCDGLRSPGSVATRSLAPGLTEVMVCNNAANTVTSHVVDRRDGWTVLASGALVAQGLRLPDGVAISNRQDWLAVSSHETREVLLYRAPDDLGPSEPPNGVLSGVSYPHGLRFTPDDRFLLVADAGAPFVRVYARGANDWSGARRPVASVRVMSEHTYLLGRHNPQEGGPKGLDVDRSGRVVAVSSEHQPLAFFDMAGAIPGLGSALRLVDVARVPPADEPARARLVGQLRRAGDSHRRAVRLAEEVEARDVVLAGRIARLEAACEESERATSMLEHDVARLAADLDVSRAGEGHERARADDLAHQIAALHQSRSWRATAVLRLAGTWIRSVGGESVLRTGGGDS